MAIEKGRAYFRDYGLKKRIQKFAIWDKEARKQLVGHISGEFIKLLMCLM